MDQDVHHGLAEHQENKKTAVMSFFSALSHSILWDEESLHYSKSGGHEKAPLWSFRFIILCHIPVQDPCEHLPARAISFRLAVFYSWVPLSAPLSSGRTSGGCIACGTIRKDVISYYLQYQKNTSQTARRAGSYAAYIRLRF